MTTALPAEIDIKLESLADVEKRYKAGVAEWISWKLAHPPGTISISPGLPFHESELDRMAARLGLTAAHRLGCCELAAHQRALQEAKEQLNRGTVVVGRETVVFKEVRKELAEARRELAQLQPAFEAAQRRFEIAAEVNARAIEALKETQGDVQRYELEIERVRRKIAASFAGAVLPKFAGVSP